MTDPVGSVPGVGIRAERPGDEAAIHRLTAAAFRDMPFSQRNEQHLVDALRRNGDLALSLVAEQGGEITGHIAFSPVAISDGTLRWFGLGPVSVWPERQGRGIGGALIRHGISELRRRGAAGLVLLGSPTYYARFGFRPLPQLRYPGPPPEYFQCLVLTGDVPTGEVRYASAFRAT